MIPFLSALVRDAKRYRWLRQQFNSYFPEENMLCEEELDEAIDRILAGERKDAGGRWSHPDHEAKPVILLHTVTTKEPPPGYKMPPPVPLWGGNPQ